MVWLLFSEDAVEEYAKLKKLIEDVADDLMKAAGGNKAAGTRVRKIMQDIRNTAQDIRQKVLEIRRTEDAQPKE
jgi:Histone H1-like protein Hc1